MIIFSLMVLSGLAILPLVIATAFFVPITTFSIILSSYSLFFAIGNAGLQHYSKKGGSDE